VAKERRSNNPQFSAAGGPVRSARADQTYRCFFPTVRRKTFESGVEAFSRRRRNQGALNFGDRNICGTERLGCASDNALAMTAELLQDAARHCHPKIIELNKKC
jgi:hypothetical protein